MAAVAALQVGLRTLRTTVGRLQSALPACRTPVYISQQNGLGLPPLTLCHSRIPSLFPLLQRYCSLPCSLSPSSFSLRYLFCPAQKLNLHLALLDKAGPCIA